MTESELLVAHFVCVLLMVGIIWFVQIVHYPLMAYVGPERFREYSALHQSRTTCVVAIPMLVEALTAGALLWWHPTLLLSPWFSTAFALLLVILASTAFGQVPLHAQLATGFDETWIRQLVRSNWIRTFAWSARAILIGATLLCRANQLAIDAA